MEGGWLKGYRSVLGEHDVRALFSALLISTTGSWAYNVALLAFVFDRTHSLGWVGAAGFARFVPQLIFSVYGGVLAERTERIRLMMGSDLLCALWQGLLALVAAANGAPALALVLAGLTAVSGVVYQPATAATIPSIVDEDDLVAANALNSTIEELVVIVGPAIGAGLLVIGSASFVFAINAASFVASALILSRMRARSRPVDVTEGGTAGPLRQMAVGVRMIIGLSAARTLVAYSVLVSFVYGTDTVLFVGVSEHRLGTGSQGFGYLLAGLGVGGVLAAGGVNRLAGARRLGAIILLGALGYCLPTALLAIIHSPALAFIVQVFRGASTLVVDVLAITALQRAVAADQLARVFGVFFAFVLGAITLGTVLTPIAVHALGLNGGLFVMAAAPAALALAGYPALRAIDRETASRALELEPTVALLEQLGIFEKASRPILERLAAAATEQTFAPGTAIVTEGDPADALYALAEGEVIVTAQREGGEETLGTMTAPAYFGEIGVLERIPRTATVTARTECRCDRIDGDAMLDALTASPPSSSLMETAQGRLAATHPTRALTFGTEQPAESERATGRLLD
jgi:CRP-like cAMP-binding protein/MFS family permease